MYLVQSVDLEPSVVNEAGPCESSCGNLPFKVIPEPNYLSSHGAGVEDKHAWYYNACFSCDEEVEIKDGKYWCERCQTNISLPRGSCVAVILDDREVQRIIKKMHLKYIWSNKGGKAGSVPKYFEKFLNEIGT